jgi:hypothetical protein
MSMTKRKLFLIEEDSKRTKNKYEWWEDEAHYAAQDDPFRFGDAQNLITGRKQGRKEHAEAAPTLVQDVHTNIHTGEEK